LTLLLTDGFDAGANRLGALALRIADRMDTALTGGGARSASSATALSAIYNFLDSPSIDQLSRVLGLTSSATVRLVDGLAADGLATRMGGSDGRVTVIELTPAGRRKAKAMVAARAGVLVDALAPLSARDRAAFERMLDQLLIGLIPKPTGKGWMCRLCDTGVCGAERGEPCPLTQAAFAER
jgi:DNA-binding MarR family transcriptional regulator